MQQPEERHAEILDFEHQVWKYQGTKETAIRDRFNMSPTRYYQVLNAVLDQPAGLVYDAMLVKRLLPLRAKRAVRRSAARGHGG